MKRIALYGGSFNPVHFGHLGIARWVVARGLADEVWMVVSPSNPLKDARVLADERERLRGVEQALSEEDKRVIKVSDVEFNLPRPSYTAATLRALAEQYKDVEWVLLMGEDNWRLFDRWREYEWIAAHYELLVYPRGEAASSEQPAWMRHTKIKGVNYLQDAPRWAISSTELRARKDFCEK